MTSSLKDFFNVCQLERLVFFVSLSSSMYFFNPGCSFKNKQFFEPSLPTKLYGKLLLFSDVSVFCSTSRALVEELVNMTENGSHIPLYFHFALPCPVRNVPCRTCKSHDPRSSKRWRPGSSSSSSHSSSCIIRKNFQLTFGPSIEICTIFLNGMPIIPSLNFETKSSALDLSKKTESRYCVDTLFVHRKTAKTWLTAMLLSVPACLKKSFWLN